jgi:hypothetical protein
VTPEIESAIAEWIACRRSFRAAEARYEKLSAEIDAARSVMDEIRRRSYGANEALMELLKAEADK